MTACAHCEDLRRQLREAKEEIAEWARGGVATNGRIERAYRVTAALRAKGLKGVRLAPGDIRLLLELLAKPGRPHSHEALLFATAVDGQLTEALPKLTAVRICTLRQLLAANGFSDVVRTVWGFGYEISAADAAKVAAWLEGLLA